MIEKKSLFSKKSGGAEAVCLLLYVNIKTFQVINKHLHWKKRF